MPTSNSRKNKGKK